MLIENPPLRKFTFQFPRFRRRQSTLRCKIWKPAGLLKPKYLKRGIQLLLRLRNYSALGPIDFRFVVLTNELCSVLQLHFGTKV